MTTTQRVHALDLIGRTMVDPYIAGRLCYVEAVKIRSAGAGELEECPSGRFGWFAICTVSGRGVTGREAVRIPDPGSVLVVAMAEGLVR